MTERRGPFRCTSGRARPIMKIEFTVPFRRVLAPRTLLVEPPPQVQGRPPRVARLVALAHKLDALVRSGAIPSYTEMPSLRTPPPSGFGISTRLTGCGS